MCLFLRPLCSSFPEQLLVPCGLCTQLSCLLLQGSELSSAATLLPPAEGFPSSYSCWSDSQKRNLRTFPIVKTLLVLPEAPRCLHPPFHSRFPAQPVSVFESQRCPCLNSGPSVGVVGFRTRTSLHFSRKCACCLGRGQVSAHRFQRSSDVTALCVFINN